MTNYEMITKLLAMMREITGGDLTHMCFDDKTNYLSMDFDEAKLTIYTSDEKKADEPDENAEFVF